MFVNGSFTAKQYDFYCCFLIKVQKCAASLWQMPLSYHFRNKVCSFISFNIFQLLKQLLTKIRYNKRCEYLKGFLSSKRVWYHLVTPKKFGGWLF